MVSYFTMLTDEHLINRTWHTLDLRVAGESLGAVAHRLVVRHEALGVDTTAARVHTIPVHIDR